MKRSFGLTVLSMGLAVAMALAGASRVSAADEGQGLLAEAQKVFKQLPDKMPGSENDTVAKIRLGRKLYNETKISINGTQSCNSCHRLDENRAGVNNEPTSPGAEGKRGGRNSPTTLNAGLHIAQFWDGRAPDLAAQAKGPVMNPIEMGMPNEAAVLEQLKKPDMKSCSRKSSRTQLSR